jgi:carbonic anhydrase/acetyltransferase-like protein (isoleucine patch superfamily)
MECNLFVHPTADVSPQTNIGEGTKIWLHCVVRGAASCRLEVAGE